MVISNCRLGLNKEGFGKVENVYIKKLCKVRHENTREKISKKS